MKERCNLLCTTTAPRSLFSPSPFALLLLPFAMFLSVATADPSQPLPPCPPSPPLPHFVRFGAPMTLTIQVDVVVEIRSDCGEYQYVGPQLKVRFCGVVFFFSHLTYMVWIFDFFSCRCTRVARSTRRSCCRAEGGRKGTPFKYTVRVLVHDFFLDAGAVALLFARITGEQGKGREGTRFTFFFFFFSSTPTV